MKDYVCLGKIMELIMKQAQKSISVNEAKELLNALKLTNNINIQLRKKMFKELDDLAKKYEFDSEWEFFEIQTEDN